MYEGSLRESVHKLNKLRVVHRKLAKLSEYQNSHTSYEVGRKSLEVTCPEEDKAITGSVLAWSHVQLIEFSDNIPKRRVVWGNMERLS